MEEAQQPEQTIWSGKCSHWHFFWKWLLVLLLLALLVATFRIDPSRLGQQAPLVRIVLAAIAVLLWIWIVFERARHSYQVTNRRVITEVGIVAKNSNEIRIQDIRSINVQRDGIAGLLGIGDVEFSSAATDDAEVIFWRIARADKVRDLIRKLQS